MSHYDNDPLWKLRHALAGVGLALLLSVPIAALLGAWVGDVVGDAVGGVDGSTYGARVTVYSLLLIYVVAGAVVLFTKVARHEQQALGAGRLLKWLASLWLWPLLLLGAAKKPSSTA